MPVYTNSSSRSSSPARPVDPSRRHRVNFAREATIDAFGRRGAEVLDQANFIDRQPGKFLMLPLVARVR